MKPVETLKFHTGALIHNKLYLITPDEGKLLRNKTTGQLYSTGLCVNKERKINDYEEIVKEEN